MVAVRLVQPCEFPANGFWLIQTVVFTGVFMDSIDFEHQNRLVYGSGTVDRLGELAREISGSRVLVVSDPGVVAAGHFQRGLDSLKSAGLEVESFHGVRENPSTKEVEAGVEVAKEFSPDLLVGLGGGSSMDCCKGINFVHSCGGKMEDYWGVGKATADLLPMIAVPTTSGTGSEAQSFALIADADTHMKMACGDKKAACKIALLDPELTLSMPTSLTVVTGIDAISHAVETYVTTKQNIISKTLSLRAFDFLVHAFPQVLTDPDNLEARGKMLLGAHLAGAAIENSMLGATHALANPLTAHFDTTHGTAIGIMLPHVVRFNAKVANYTELARTAGLEPTNTLEAGELLADHLRELFNMAGSPATLNDISFDAELLPKLAEEAADQWTGNFNPHPVEAQILLELYRKALA